MTRGFVALIDDKDYPLVSRYKWHVHEDDSSTESRFYAHTNVPKTANRPRTKLQLHRLIMNAQPGEKIDHRSGDGLDCRRANLRSSTDSQNGGNRGSFTGTSKYKGVSWSAEKRAWRAAIYHDGRTRFLGYFGSEDEAATAYDREAVAIHGEFARLNDVSDRTGPITSPANLLGRTS
ncbi:endonuclease [Gemmata sp. G18]|uniref:Endonuclease n=1 Tax=Gemmata palustris TaxID=2822762 RepID=A0ABS5BNP3_9BACT|nr:endonuclease [Gemmata palustris]MBP3954935.1 endonuclease [Gemmata palustris]